MNNEDLIDKYRYIDINKYNCKTTQALDFFWNQRESSTCIAAQCSTNDSNINMQNTYLVAMLLNTL